MLQGKLAQAEAIYTVLLEEQPGDPRALEGLAEVKRRATAGEEPLGADRVELRADAEGLRCQYLVTEEGRRRAELVLGRPGALILRVLGFPAPGDRPPSDHPLEATSGELTVPAPARSRVIAAAVGLRGEGEAFVAIAHCTTGGPT